jgi:hypothetical protein
LHAAWRNCFIECALPGGHVQNLWSEFVMPDFSFQVCTAARLCKQVNKSYQ